MMRGMFSAISGLKAHQIMLDVTANNLANVNTVGYKSSRTSFRDSLTQMQRAGAAANANFGGANAAQVGLGVQLGSIDNLMGGGAFQSTGNQLDVGIQGDGWFRVVTGDPADPVPGPDRMQYSRVGNFTRNSEGNLVTQDGFYVVGKEAAQPVPGDPIVPAGGDVYLRIPDGATDIAVSPDGLVSYVPAGGVIPPGAPNLNGRVAAGYLSLAKFPNEAGLERVANNRWRAGAPTGGETAGTPGAAGGFGLTIGGVLEMSNVDLATEFTNMITAQRGFQANSRVISTSDQMLQDLVNLNR